jgi:hypothetical protein
VRKLIVRKLVLICFVILNIIIPQQGAPILVSCGSLSLLLQQGCRRCKFMLATFSQKELTYVLW